MQSDVEVAEGAGFEQTPAGPVGELAKSLATDASRPGKAEFTQKPSELIQDGGTSAGFL
jgi:hypothetical protein